MAENDVDNELLDYEDDEVENAAGAEGAEAPPKKDVKGSYVSIHSSGFRDFLLKPELLRAIVDCGFEHPSEGGGCGGGGPSGSPRGRGGPQGLCRGTGRRLCSWGPLGGARGCARVPRAPLAPCRGSWGPFWGAGIQGGGGAGGS